MNFLKKLLSRLVKVIHSKKNVTVVFIEQDPKIVVDGKVIDPKSPQGKAILKEVTALERNMDALRNDMEKMAKDITNHLKNI